MSNKRGITLIALIVTIVVLLILAGVSIVTLSGDNGLLNRTTSAKEKTEQAGIMENIKLAYQNALIGRYANNEDNQAIARQIESDLKGIYGQDSGVTVTEENGVYTVTTPDGRYTIDASGSVSRLEGLTISQTSLNLQKREGETPTATAITATKYGIEGTVSWSISPAGVATISPETGDEIYVTPAAGGSATLTATCGDKSKECTITVVEVSKVTVTFNLNGGSVDNSTENITRQEFPGDTIDPLPVPTKTDYEFKGWYNNQELTGKPAIIATATTVEVQEAITYYAKWAEPALTYGAEADLGTVTVNSTALTRGWKYFYDDGTNIYLIYENYLESAQIPIPSGTNISKDGYNVYASGNRNNLLNYLNDESTSESGTWSGFAAGVQNALAAKDINTTVEAKGAPTLEQFAGSYQANYPGDEFDVAYRNSTDKIDGTNGTLSQVNAAGYVYKKKNQSWAYYQSLGNSENGKDLYFPETSTVKPTGQTNDTYGYWLAGLSAYGSRDVCGANYFGGADYYYFSSDFCGVRPVVSIPKSDTLMSKLGLN